MNYQFANLLGAPYRGGNLLLHGPELLSPVGNRVSQVSNTLACMAAIGTPASQ
jgi:periodic tryptophan protein 2